jgi:hypothetical protein
MSPRTLSLAAVLIVSALVSVSPATPAEGLTAHDIMEKNFFVSKLKSMKAEASMVLIDEKGQKRERKSQNIVKLQPNGIDSRVLVKFDAPNDIKGTSFLQIEHADSDDDLWIYLPALKKSRRLVASNKKDSFVGSDFSYGDILLPKVDLYRHTLLRSETIDNHECFVIESVPANDTVKTNSGYSKRITWVRRDNFLEQKVEYFDLSGRLLKTQTVTDHKLVEPDTQRWFALHREMTNHQTGHRTDFRFDKVEPGIAVADEVFSIRYLERE